VSESGLDRSGDEQLAEGSGRNPTQVELDARIAAGEGDVPVDADWDQGSEE
jgi:hypothetical protein